MVPGEGRRGISGSPIEAFSPSWRCLMALYVRRVLHKVRRIWCRWQKTDRFTRNVLEDPWVTLWFMWQSRGIRTNVAVQKHGSTEVVCILTHENSSEVPPRRRPSNATATAIPIGPGSVYCRPSRLTFHSPKFIFIAFWKNCKIIDWLMALGINVAHKPKI